jgi:hypothetical protein
VDERIEELVVFEVSCADEKLGHQDSPQRSHRGQPAEAP